jgi:hypothetical protein
LNAFSRGSEADRLKDVQGRQEGRLDTELGLKADTLTETQRSNKADEAAALARIESNDNYYASILANAKLKTTLTQNQALTQAIDIAKSQLDGFASQLALLVPGEPGYDKVLSEFIRSSQVYEARVLDLAQRLQGTSGQTAPAPAGGLSQDAIRLLQSQGVPQANIDAYQRSLGIEATGAAAPPATGEPVGREDFGRQEDFSGAAPPTLVSDTPPAEDSVFDKPGTEGGIFDQKRARSAELIASIQPELMTAAELQTFLIDNRDELTSTHYNTLRRALSSKF